MEYGDVNPAGRPGQEPSGPRVLLVRPDHLGDVLFTLPAAAVLRRAIPGARLTYLVPSGLQDLIRRCPAVDDVMHLPFPPPDRPADLRQWAAVVDREARRLRDRFDTALLLRPTDPCAGALIQAAAVPDRLGFLESATVPYLTHGIRHRAEAHAVEGAITLAELALRRLGATHPPAHPPPGAERLVVPTSGDRRAVEQLLASLGGDVGDRPFVLHPGTGWPLKLWSAQRWGRVAAEIFQRFGRRPLITGVLSERELVDRVVTASGGRAVGLPGRLTLGVFAALLERSTMLVASDSGPLHLAAMVGTRVVGLYGPGGPLQAGPWCPPERRRLVWVDLPCRPCGTMEYAPCGATTNPACVTGTTVDQVLAAAESLATGTSLTEAAAQRYPATREPRRVSL